jgi:hypothetical protein
LQTHLGYILCLLRLPDEMVLCIALEETILGLILHVSLLFMAEGLATLTGLARPVSGRVSDVLSFKSFRSSILFTG